MARLKKAKSAKKSKYTRKLGDARGHVDLYEARKKKKKKSSAASKSSGKGGGGGGS